MQPITLDCQLQCSQVEPWLGNEKPLVQFLSVLVFYLKIIAVPQSFTLARFHGFKAKRKFIFFFLFFFFLSCITLLLLYKHFFFLCRSSIVIGASQRLTWTAGYHLLPLLYCFFAHQTVSRLGMRMRFRQRIGDAFSSICFTQFSYSPLDRPNQLYWFAASRHRCIVQQSENEPSNIRYFAFERIVTAWTQLIVPHHDQLNFP